MVTETDAGTAPGAGRLRSLDQFRGYTVAGMLLVNFVGGAAAVPAILKHHNTYCSYADTIMPQFFFAVGFAYRMTFLRRLATAGAASAYGHAIRRNLGLILLGAVIYHLDGGAKAWAELTAMGWRGFLATAFQRNVFQTLVHIGVTSLWVLPVIAAGRRAQVAFLVGSAALHLELSRAFYFDWAWDRPVIDGGPLGFLTWTIPLLLGSLTYDASARAGGRPSPGRMLLVGAGIMALGYALANGGALLGGSSGAGAGWASPPFVPPEGPVDLWTMSQRTGSVSYLTFAAGFSLAVYALFALACDRGGFGLGLFDLFGRHALAAYVIHGIVAAAVKPYLPKDAPGWYVAAAFGLYFAITWLFVRHVDRRGARI